MKNPYLIIFCVFVFSVAYLQKPIHTLTKDNYLFPENKDKQFISAEEFFINGNLMNYTEFKKANINFRQKLLYKDLKLFIKSKVNEYYYKNLYNIYAYQHRGVSPYRQVYFYCSVLDNEKTFKYKFLILDAETTKKIGEGSGQKYKETN